MDFEEFCWALGEEQAADFLAQLRGPHALTAFERLDDMMHNQFWAIYQRYLICGGMPEIVDLFVNTKDEHLAASEKVRHRQYELITDYCADMAKHSGKTNALSIERVFKAIPA